jgi:hypothetical protein
MTEAKQKILPCTTWNHHKWLPERKWLTPGKQELQTCKFCNQVRTIVVKNNEETEGEEG